MDYKKLNEKMSKFFDNVTGEELVAQLEELGYKLIEKEQQVKSVDLADVGGNEVALPTDDDVNTESALNMGRTLDMGKQ